MAQYTLHVVAQEGDIDCPEIHVSASNVPHQRIAVELLEHAAHITGPAPHPTEDPLMLIAQLRVALSRITYTLDDQTEQSLLDMFAKVLDTMEGHTRLVRTALVMREMGARPLAIVTVPDDDGA